MLKEYGLYDVLDFGKNSGVTVEQIIDSNYEYMDWLIEERIICLDNKAYAAFINSGG